MHLTKYGSLESDFQNLLTGRKKAVVLFRLWHVQLASFGTPKHQPTVDDAIRILLTGGAGFIASHVALQLVERYPVYEVSYRKKAAGNCANART